ncbi:UDP-4-amino-4,6-dideoxy-N-acetyl-beta-L-altrosamine transaminase [Coraliomargarita algicola]|uniref:UDP-4-amino-4, 6-dideoxy-N-acetyl-beta-L-altrosamine transaminase n=1 Tax=Coraliomargarita algicola TaxID=3092156 RepID=A0ABZ0RM88_9BACT|nr:UDP-4-amino-4,6-dideoxy-N-acetyl-beta-L-altrosamine transaminase [Coraliomargarita sp. J2-16]WPJ97334.1 UDP-4-amino-4,6-dideoxy-N-acetyl-beta-L-altrosamine transaminase [Coraliomargarita sp. J2-16]
MIPYGKQTIDEDDIAAVVAALKSDFLTCGPEIDAFEQEFAAMVGAKHAVVVCNATAALHLAMLVADVGVGDRVVTSPNTFLSSANCAAFVGAIPDFADIDSDSYNLCPVALEQHWQADTKAVVAVAYAGQSPDMPEIARVARAHGAVVIEDGCHGTGGGFFYEGEKYKIGGHPWADMTTFSFHPVKTMTTGEGGVLVTDNAEYAAKARLLRGHGMVREPEKLEGLGTHVGPLAERGPWMYEMQQLGYNYRITDLQCALGRSQLKKLPRFIERRQEIVAKYNEAFQALSWLQTPQVLLEASRSQISWHLYTVQIDFEALGKSRSEVMAELRSQGVGTQVLYIPVYLQPWYRKLYDYAVGKCPNAEIYYQKTLSLPLFPGMNESDVDAVIRSVKHLIK